MFLKRTKNEIILSFIVFAIIILEDIFVSYLHLIPERSRINRIISWLTILPLALISMILSMQVI